MSKKIVDEYSDEVKDLAYKVYTYSKLYRYNIHMYNVKIKELSNSSKYSEKYLKSLKQVYRDLYATKQEIIDEKNLNKELSMVSPEYIEFGDKLFELPEARRNNFVLSSKKTISWVNDKLTKYKKHKGKYYYLVDDFLSQYNVFYVDYCESEKKKNKLIDYKKSLAIFSEIINLGFYSISHYSDFLYGPGDDYKKSISRLNSLKRKIVGYDDYYGKNNWDIISKGFEINRKRTYLILKDRVDSFNLKLRGNLNDSSFNVIDYYLIVGIPFKNYRDICSGFISSFDMANFDIFANKYGKVESDTSYFERVDKKISDDEKAMLFSFLKENSIPECYFNFAVEKYINGELDNYVNVKKKLI